MILFCVLLVGLVFTWWSLNEGWHGTIRGTWAKLLSPSSTPSSPVAVYSPQYNPALPAKTKKEASTASTASPALSDDTLPKPERASGNLVIRDGSPITSLKACIDKLRQNDLIGAEQYVSENGMRFTYGNTQGIHEVLWKGLVKLHTYDEIGYDETSVAGQTAWVPLYTRLGNNRMTTMLIMANRGDGWKLDHLCDVRRY